MTGDRERRKVSSDCKVVLDKKDKIKMDKIWIYEGPSNIKNSCWNSYFHIAIENSKNKNYEYFDLGKKVIWDCIEEMPDYDYYHFPSEYL